MSLLLPCPHCGPRPVAEYVYGEIITVPASVVDPDTRDLDRAYFHDNPAGPVTERWFHVYGCRRWLTITRDTRTDEILPS